MVDWKKEISFGGGKKKEKVDAAAASPEQVPFWKKEISLGRKQKVEKQQVETVVAPEPVVYEIPPSDGRTAEEMFGALLGDATTPRAVEVVDTNLPVAEAVVAVPDPEPVAAASALDLVDSYMPPAEPVATYDAARVAEVLPITPQPVVSEPVAEVPPVAPAPVVPVTPTPAAAPPTSQIPIPVAATPPAPVPVSAPSAVPAPVVVHPPVPAAELPPLDDESTGEKKPFYKRELSFGRKPKVEKPAKEKGEKEQKAPKPKRERPSLSFSLPRPAPRARGGGKGGKGGKVPKRIVGLKVGASQVAAATVTNNGHAEVDQLARMPLDAGVIAGGELRDPDALADALKTFFKKNKLPKRGVRLGIATNRIGVRTLEIAGIEDAKQMANAIRFRAQEALPIPIDEAVLDYHVLSEGKNAEGETVRKILLVLVYRELVDRYVAACRKAGIQLVGIDLEAFALLRALSAPREEDAAAESAVVAVTIGHDRTTFAVSDGRTCEFTRVLDWGGQSLNVAIARALDMAPSEVEDFKRALSLDGVEVPTGMTPEGAHAARDALRKHVQTFARELVSSLQFYQNQTGSLGIGEIVLTGGTAHLAGLAAELQRLIGVRVRVGDPLVRVKLAKKFKEPEQLGSLAVAIGLGIED